MTETGLSYVSKSFTWAGCHGKEEGGGGREGGPGPLPNSPLASATDKDIPERGGRLTPLPLPRSGHLPTQACA